ncbi:39S ribosomal protein L39, mitochondrial [Trichinella spiralis]|uniref:39S ribosomal protein L39, mitochondrial n=1 Tax=Trichinella spiralis TaxID=6334 RepID=A0A0V1BGC1_TRISP|nr:39S ribosomal protein L39, mitochondrial [Trichinella spiralis]KRY36000.1 39S ribosomal protein L39, mitochondrial [Trichinella spiralis]
MSTTGLLGSGGGHRWCFGKVKSADHRLKSRPKVVEEYEKEESEILEQIEKIRQSRKKTSLATFSGAACWRRRAEWRSFNQSTSECGSSLLSTSATMMQPMPGDLLTSMCHLMNFVVHLRRENRHLRRQIVCLDEMRKVERLQCEILQSACACIAVNRRQSNNASSLDAESGYEASNCSQLATEGPTAGSQLIFNSLNHQRTDSNNTTTDTSSVQSPTSTSHLNRAPLFLSKTDDHFLDCNQLVKNDHPIQPSLSTTKQHNLLKPMDPSRRDSDDQVIFSEVLLPNYNSSSNSGAKKLPLQNRQSLPINHCSSTSSTACYAPLSFPETNSGRVSRLLERFGIKRHSWKKSIRSSASVEEERRRQSERGATSEPHLHHGSSSSPTFSQLRPRTELIFHNSSNKQRLLAGRKAFLKKRKRKISESDSWASSEASKVYSVIEIPEKLDLKFRGLATKPFSLVKKKDGFDEASFSADVPRKEAMDSVMVENQFYLDDSFEPAKESTIVPLRTTRQAMRITSPEKALLHHASVDKQRISEKCQSNDNNNNSNSNNRCKALIADMVSSFTHSVSETNINHLDQLDKTVQNNPPSQLSLQPDSANYFRTDPGLSNLLQTAGVNLSLTPSQMTVSNDSVFTSHETDLNRYVSGMNVLKQLLALQEKNSILIRQLREKTSEYESIVERVANLEGSMKTLRNRLKFNNLLESLFERNIEKHCVPLSVQLTMEANAKQQIINQQYWEKLESLLISKEFFENDNKKSNKEESSSLVKDYQIERDYQSLFVFTVKLLRKLHTVRNSLLEKLNAYSNVNVELMQTQSSLLLAHAQIERQRLEIQQLSNRNARIRRADSYHGQDLVEKLVNSKFSFYLPFKLYGSRMTTVGGEKKKKDPRSCLPDEMLEAEFANLPKDSSSDAVAMQAFSQTKQLNSNNNSTPPIGRGISKSEKEPRNSGIDIRQRTTISGGFEGSTSRLPASLLVKKQSPSLQRLSKMGHVRALAATFDSPNGLKVDEKYPPGTSMNPFEYSLHYGQQNFHCHHQQDAKRSQHHDSETSSSAAAAAEKPPAPAPATTISQSSKIPAFGNFATVTRLRRATDAVSDVKNANCRETFSTTTTTTTTTTRFCNKTTASPKVPVTGASNQDRKINFTANKANTFAGRITSESEEISRKKNNNAALLASTMSTTSSVSCLKSNIPTNVVNIREVSNRTATPKSISRSVTNQFLPIKSANICYDKELRKSNKSDTTNVDEVPPKTTTGWLQRDTWLVVMVLLHTRLLSSLLLPQRAATNCIILQSTLRRQLSLQDARIQRSLVFEEEKVRQENLLGKVEKIVVKMQLPNSYLPKNGNSVELVMNANMSTPHHCAMHVSRMLADRSPLALVNNKPWDMHRPLPSTDCNLQFLFFTDLNPHLVNKAFWRTCSFVLGYIFETSLKKSIGVTLHSWPFVNVSSGSFIYDIALQMNNNLTIKKADLDVLGRVVVDDLRKKNFPFERLEVGVDVLEEMFKNNNFKLEQIKNMANKGDECGTFSVYRMGDHVDISKGPMISSTAQLGLYSVTAMHPIQTEDNLSLYRVQGCALPFNQRVNSWTWETVCRTSANLNLIPEEKKYATRSFNLRKYKLTNLARIRFERLEVKQNDMNQPPSQAIKSVTSVQVVK